jgi:hypothetical protein
MNFVRKCQDYQPTLVPTAEDSSLGTFSVVELDSVTSTIARGKVWSAYLTAFAITMKL